jgi:hypothetical protein
MSNQEIIISALLSGQKEVMVGSMHIELKALKRDTQRCREKEATKMADAICKVINS